MEHAPQPTAAALAGRDRHRIEALAATFRAAEPGFEAWARGCGPVVHDPLTQLRVRSMVDELVAAGRLPDRATGWERLRAADRLASAGMWLVVHMSYALRVRGDGAPLQPGDFKPQPEGHTGGALNMVPAYAGYLLMNALDGVTRAWTMGQGHCVAAIDALNLLVGNTSPAHAAYGTDDAGLSRFVADFYAYRLAPDGTPGSPLGSHVNAHTAGGTGEGGYLGFTELEYVHGPLPGERLVAFLSDGAFEEQRGGDWAPRWWRAEDSGFVAPIMVLNGRRIEQRSSIEQQGGEAWLDRHLRLHGFEPVHLDGRDPASIAWGIHAMESRLAACAAGASGRGHPPLLRYGVAETIKGYGFPGAGTNLAHNLPLPGNPAHDARARQLFNEGAAALHVPPDLLADAVRALTPHAAQGRPRERDHALATRDVALPTIPEPQWRPVPGSESPMRALDGLFVAIVEANPQLRPRVGNPDELRSNRLDQTLDRLLHRVQDAEPGVAESPTGAVITALNEEAVACAALGNSGGINLVATYEAFGVKMLGAIRQHVIFARHKAEAGQPRRSLSVPFLLTSHTWENGKNEQSHQDPTLAEALLGEMADTARVLFPPDANAAMAALEEVYGRHGCYVAMVVAKRDVPSRLGPAAARRLAADGVLCMAGDPGAARLLLAATGAYQLEAALLAHARLQGAGLAAALLCIAEPGRLRSPRDAREAAWVLADAQLAPLFPARTPRVFVTHTRPEPYLGALRRLDTGPGTTRALGYINRGGTLDVQGLLFANRCSHAHVLESAAQVLGLPRTDLLTAAECAALDGHGDPAVVTAAGTGA